jgi:hypothetical protein
LIHSDSVSGQIISSISLPEESPVSGLHLSKELRAWDQHQLTKLKILGKCVGYNKRETGCCFEIDLETID